MIFQYAIAALVGLLIVLWIVTLRREVKREKAHTEFYMLQAEQLDNRYYEKVQEIHELTAQIKTIESREKEFQEELYKANTRLTQTTNELAQTLYKELINELLAKDDLSEDLLKFTKQLIDASEQGMTLHGVKQWNRINNNRYLYKAHPSQSQRHKSWEASIANHYRNQ